MNAIPRQKTPRTVQQLTADLADYERLLRETTRANNAARAELPGHIAGGDAEAIAHCRRQLSTTAAEIKEFTDAIEIARDAIRAGQERDRAATDAQAYSALKRRVGATRQEVESLADAIVTFAVALKKSGAALDSTDALMRDSGVTPDPYILKAKLVGLVEVALHLETGGFVGVARTLESPDELRRSGRADLKRAAVEFQAVYLRHARQQLHIMREE